jgi:hypothetical protein
MSAPSSSTGFAAAQSASPSPSKRFFSFLMSSNSSAKSSTSRSRSYSVSSTRAPLAAIEPNLARTTLPHFQTGDGRIVNSKAGKLLAIVIPSNKSRVIVEVDEVEEEDDPYSTEDRPSINNSLVHCFLSRAALTPTLTKLLLQITGSHRAASSPFSLVPCFC